jgi:ribosome recycling factor
MDEQQIKDHLTEKLGKAQEKLAANLNTVRAGKANPALLDRVFVDYYDTPTPLKALANTAAIDGNTLVVTPFDAGNLKAIEKGIVSENLGVTVTNDGKVVRIAVPQLTEERRQELVKTVKGFAEDAKIAVRNARREANEAYEKMEKADELTEDDLKHERKEVQKAVDAAVGQIEQAVSKKEQDLLII